VSALCEKFFYPLIFAMPQPSMSSMMVCVISRFSELSNGYI
jgi:hypothetical protein